MENKNETSRILNSAKLLGEGAMMVDSTSGPRIEVTKTQFDDAQADMEADLGVRESQEPIPDEPSSKEVRSEDSIKYWEKIVNGRLGYARQLTDVIDQIRGLAGQGMNPEQIADSFAESVAKLEADTYDLIDRKGLNKG